VSAFIDEWFRTPADEDEYLSKVGIRRLRELLC
jgi:hypothetical protein